MRIVVLVLFWLGCSSPNTVEQRDAAMQKDAIATCSSATCNTGDTRACAELGYYAGNAACNATCTGWDETTCQACGDSAIGCERLADKEAPTAIAVSGSTAAVLTTSQLYLVDGTTVTGSVSIQEGYAVAAVDGGWLVAQERAAFDFVPSVARVENDGTVGPAHALPAPLGRIDMVSVSDRALVAWTTGTDVKIAIVDANGELVTSKTLFAGTTSEPSAASDGTHFFVGAGGKLARIDRDGTAVVTTGFADGPLTFVRWFESGGWYIAESQVSDLTARRFDANGDGSGAAITFNIGDTPVDMLADGDELLVMRVISKRLSVVRVTSAGPQSVTDIGTGFGRGLAHMVHVGDNILAAWLKDTVPQDAQIGLFPRP